MAFEKYSTEQLKRWQKRLLIAAIAALVLMCFALGMGLYQMSNSDNNTLICLVPTVFGPLCFIPILFSGAISSELKKRQS